MQFRIEQFDQFKNSWSIQDYVNIGKDSSCQIQIHTGQIDPRHCRLEIKEKKLFIKDLRSTTGTFVNGAQILEAQLNDGDIVGLGDIEFVIHDLKQKSENFPMSSRNYDWNEQLQSLKNVSQTHHTVLLLGASGTGKDVIAKNIHQYSDRQNQPFLSVNCSALTETLVESELFGHIKGSFTGALCDRKGAFEAARGGTLFLDEIGDLSYALQAKLLRALENEEIRPVGSDKIVKTDVRIIAATHQNLYEKIQDGSFRSDLFFRLNIINLEVPSLNHRMEDFDDLIYSFAREQRVRFSFNAIQRLKKYTWPGNIRELKNLVTRTSTLYAKTYITDEIIEKLLSQNKSSRSLPIENTQDRPQNISVIKEIEKQMIIKRLVANKGSQKKTASDLGMPKSTLHDRLKNYEISPEQFRQ